MSMLFSAVINKLMDLKGETVFKELLSVFERKLLDVFKVPMFFEPFSAVSIQMT